MTDQQTHAPAPVSGYGNQTGVVREVPQPGSSPLFTHPDWQERFPWLLQATTGRGSASDEFDLSFFGQTATGQLQERWKAVRSATGFPAVVHARQVHSNDLHVHADCHPGISVRPDADGHITDQTGLLLAVSVADCVPIFVVAERSRVIALLHAGWRGVAAQILENAVEQILRLPGTSLADLHCHLGPAICGNCYEVGPEVHEALGLSRPARNTPVDLRAVLRQHAVVLGLAPANITQSGWCTRCDNRFFFSHRAGDRGRQMGLLGLRAP